MTSAAPLRQLLPRVRDNVDLAAAYAYPESLQRPWIRANMVSSADGAAVDAAGSSRGLSSAADRQVLALLRGLSDVILVGAGTARAESYRPPRARESWSELRRDRPATPRMAVVTRTLDVHPQLLEAAPEARTLLLTTGAAPQEQRREVARRAEVAVVDSDTSGRACPTAVVQELADRGLHRVVCEGGPHLLGDLTRAGLVDELCLTLSPMLRGPGASRVVAGPEHPAASPPPDLPQGLRLASLLTSADALFTRYVRTNRHPADNPHA